MHFCSIRSTFVSKSLILKWSQIATRVRAAGRARKRCPSSTLRTCYRSAQADFTAELTRLSVWTSGLTARTQDKPWTAGGQPYGLPTPRPPLAPLAHTACLALSRMRCSAPTREAPRNARIPSPHRPRAGFGYLLTASATPSWAAACTGCVVLDCIWMCSFSGFSCSVRHGRTSPEASPDFRSHPCKCECFLLEKSTGYDSRDSLLRRVTPW